MLGVTGKIPDDLGPTVAPLVLKLANVIISPLLQRAVYGLSKKDLLFLGYDIIVRGFLECSYLLTSTNLKQAIGLAQKIVEKSFVYIKWLPNFPFQCN